MANTLKTTFLLGLMTILIVIIGQTLGGNQGMIIAFVIAAGMNFFSYWFSDKIVLATYKAHEVRQEDNPALHNMVRKLAAGAELPMPRVYIIPGEQPNAFATGRNPSHAAVAVTQGLLKLMNEKELEGVIAHELAHVKNRDILIGSIAATMAGAIMIIANMARWAAIFGGRGGGRGGSNAIGLLLTAIIAPLAAMLIQMAISRSREYQADKTGAYLTKNPEGLASALEKLGMYSGRIPSEASPSSAHIFTVSPLKGGGIANMFSTHPPIAERITRLRGTKYMPISSSGSGGTPDSSVVASSRNNDAQAMWKKLSGK